VHCWKVSLVWLTSYASQFQDPLPQEQQWLAMLQQLRLWLPQEQLWVAMLQQHRQAQQG
jgi:hypothetical protein